MKNTLASKALSTLMLAALLAMTSFTARAQIVTTPVPDTAISWDYDQYGFDGAVQNSHLPVTNNPAGLALSTNWNDGWCENSSAVASGGVTVTNLFDSTGALSGVSLTYAAVNGASVVAMHVGPDANGTYNREMIDGYLNAGPASYGPPRTNSYVTISNVPYSKYDVVVYFSTDTSGRNYQITDGTTSYYGTTLGGAELSGANALFLPSTQTNNSQFPPSDFVFFQGETSSNLTITCYPLNGDDQWLGIAGFQIIQESNTYVFYGAAPATQTTNIGGSPSFSVMASGLNPQYQWYQNGTAVTNATNATYTIPSATLGSAGGYYAVVSNSFSAATSAVANLVVYPPKNLRWSGEDFTWDTNATPDAWTTNNDTGTVVFTDTDHVTFDSLGTAIPFAYVQNSDVMPGSITVSNASYTLQPFQGYSLTGGGPLNVISNAALILDMSDARSGPTTIGSGCMLQVGQGDVTFSGIYNAQLGTGPLTNNGALIFDFDANYAYGFPIFGNGNITNLSPAGQLTLGGSVSANQFVQAGLGSVLLQGVNTFPGGMVVNAGTVLARVVGDLGNGPVVVNGGQLQLIFGLDYAGSNLSLTIASASLATPPLDSTGGTALFDGPVSLATNCTIEVAGGSSLNLRYTNGLQGGGNILTLSTSGAGVGTLILAGASNTWGGVNIVTNTALQIGNGTNGSMGGGTIQDNGILAFNASTTVTVTNPISGSGALNQNGSGTVVLKADNDSAGFTGAINITNGTLLVSGGGTSGNGQVTLTAGTLGGNGTIGGAVTNSAGSTLSPSAGGTPVTLTVLGGLSIGGNLAINVNKSLAQTNDKVAVTGGLANVGTGNLTVNNVGPALAVGDTFTIFNQAVTGGNTLTVSGAGAIWTNNLAANGSITVLSVSVPRPVITGATLVGGTILVFHGTNGTAGGPYSVLSSTNVAAPLSSWTAVKSGSFDGSGNFTVTNTITNGIPRRFFILQQP